MQKHTGIVLVLIVGLLLLAMGVQAEFGSGWSAAFYDNISFSDGPVATYSGINGLNFNWPNKPNFSGITVEDVGEDNFSVRFTSTQNFAAGSYRFDMFVDDNIRVFINDERVFEDFSGGPGKALSFTREMTAGSHNLRVDFVEVSGPAVLQFQWNLAGSSSQPVPTSIYTPVPQPTAIPPLTASVSTSVRGLAVRTGPYLGASMVAVAVPGQNYPVLAQNTSAEGITWYQIEVNGHVGWSSGRYLVFNTDPAGVGGAGSVFDSLGAPEETGVIAVPRSVMKLRAQPSTRAAELALVPWGAELPLYNRTVQGGQDRWYQVNYEGQLGWIFAPYVSVRGDIRNVPVR